MDQSVYDMLHQVQERHWWYAARREIFDRVLRSEVAPHVPEGTWYDLGCGLGANLPVLRRFGTTLGVDASPEAIAYCRDRGLTDVMRSDLNSLEGLPDESGSVVLLADVIEHLDDEAPCLAAAHRLLKPGGMLVVTVPAFRFLWTVADDLAHHRRRYTERELRSVIGRHFEVLSSTYFNTFLFPPVLLGRMLEKVLNRNGQDGGRVPPKWLNDGLTRVFAAEAPLLGRVHLPFGVSLLCLARKVR